MTSPMRPATPADMDPDDAPVTAPPGGWPSGDPPAGPQPAGPEPVARTPRWVVLAVIGASGRLFMSGEPVELRAARDHIVSMLARLPGR